MVNTFHGTSHPYVICHNLSVQQYPQMSRKEWLWAMWQAPTWWDSWRLLKDGRHQVDILSFLSFKRCLLHLTLFFDCYPHGSFVI